MIPSKLTPATFIHLARRRPWALAAPLALSLMVLMGLWATLPRLYKSEATILLQPQELPPNYVTSFATYGVKDRLQALSQSIVSRQRLAEIARRFRLYPALQGGGDQDLAERLQQDLELSELSDRVSLEDKRPRTRELVYFRLGFTYPEPRTAQAVAWRLARLFGEENRRLRDQQSRLTTAFLDRELAATKERLAAQEQRLGDYRRRYMGELPEQLEVNLAALSRLQADIQTNQAALAGAQERAVLLQRSLAETAPALPASIMPAKGSSAPAVVTGTPAARLVELRQSLPGLEARYTPRHPNVIRTRNEIRRLEEELTRTPQEAPPRLVLAPAPGRDPLLGDLITVRSEIERLRLEQESAKEKVQIYQQRVEATPRREQELAELSRGYEMLQQSYQSLLGKRLEARMAGDLKGQGEQFRVVDPPSLPERPFAPSWPKFFAVALFLGLGGGLVLVFAREAADRTFRDLTDLKDTLGVRVLAVIPLVRTEAELLRERRRRGAALTGGALVLMVYTALLLYARHRGLTLHLPL